MIPCAFLLAAGAAATTAATPFPKNDDSKVICKTMQGTQSRLDTYRVCLPKREWRRLADESEEGLRKRQDNYSKSSQTPF